MEKKGCLSTLHFSWTCIPSKQISEQLLSFLFFLNFWIYLFIFGCVGSSFLCEGFL